MAKLIYGYLKKFDNHEMKKIVNESEAIVIRQIYNDSYESNSYSALSKRYNMPVEKIRRILSEKRYIGNDNYPSIVSQKSFDKAQLAISEWSNKSNYLKSQFLFTGLLKCEKCGCKLQYKKTVGNKHIRIICPHKSCKFIHDAYDLERNVIDKLQNDNLFIELRNDPKFIQLSNLYREPEKYCEIDKKEDIIFSIIAHNQDLIKYNKLLFHRYYSDLCITVHCAQKPQP